jgi:hypothetical protein
MRSALVRLTAVLSTLAALGGAPAHADEPKADGYPVRYIDRPLTLPARFVSGTVGGGYVKYGAGTDTWEASLAAGYGITSDLEVDLAPLPVQFSPQFQYGSSLNLAPQFQSANPNLAATYRFYHQPNVEIGGGLAATAVTHNTDFYGAAIVTPYVPVLLRVANLVRIDTGASFSVALGGTTTQTALAVPVNAAVQIVDPFYAGLATGFGVGQLSNFSNTAYVPLGVFAGYVVVQDVVDVRASFAFPIFVTPGGQDTINTDAITAGLNVLGIWDWDWSNPHCHPVGKKVDCTPGEISIEPYGETGGGTTGWAHGQMGTVEVFHQLGTIIEGGQGFVSPSAGASLEPVHNLIDSIEKGKKDRGEAIGWQITVHVTYEICKSNGYYGSGSTESPPFDVPGAYLKGDVGKAWDLSSLGTDPALAKAIEDAAQAAAGKVCE